MVYVQVFYVIGIVTILPCVAYPETGEPAGGVAWTYFASPSIPQEFLYNTPVRVFVSSFNYPVRDYEMWGLANVPPLGNAAPSTRTPRTKRATLQQEAFTTGKHERSKRFLPYMYGGMPGMMMGGYGTGMASASASAMAGSSYGSYGSYGYPFF